MDDCQGKGPWERTRLILQVILLFLTVAGNVLVILSILVVKVLRHPRKYLVVSLAVADLLVGVGVIPFKIRLTENCNTWKVGTISCVIWVSGDITLCCASILGLTLISIDRYFAIGKPLYHKVNFTATKIYFLIGLTWIISVIPIIPYWALVTLRREVTSGYSSYEVCVQDQTPWFEIVGVVNSFFVPLGILIFVYGTILRVLKRRELKFNRAVHRKLRDTTWSYAVYRLVEEKIGCIMTGVVVLVFVICWLPFYALILTRAICEMLGKNFNIAPWLVHLCIWLGYFNSCANPIIYTMFNKEFRFAFKELICFRWSTLNSQIRSEIYAKQMHSSISTKSVSIMSTKMTSKEDQNSRIVDSEKTTTVM